MAVLPGRQALTISALTVAVLPIMATLTPRLQLYFLSRQGQGVGSAALATALQETDALGLAVFLATQVDQS